MTQQSGFSQFFIGDINNTLVDISPYVKTAKVPLGFAVIDLTSFTPGAVNAPTVQMKHGQIQSEPGLTLYDDLFWYSTICQIMGLRTGSTFRALTGRNAVPQPGDFMYQATLTLFSSASDFSTKKDVTSVFVLKPSDGGTIIPAITRI